MHRSTTRTLAALALASMTFAAAPFPAVAQVPYGTACTLPAGSFGGTGIPTDNVFCSTLRDITMGLSATPRYTSPDVTTNSAGTFYAQPGNSTGGPSNVGFATWNFDYFVGGASLNDYFGLYLDLNPGLATAPMFISAWVGDNHDSSNLGYLHSAFFDPNASGEYTVELRRYTDQNLLNQVDRVAINVDVGTTVTATPEPASLALMATGLVGLGGATTLKRRKLRQPAAQAIVA